MNILITGGTGFIGQALVPYLQQQGHHTTIVTRNKDKVVKHNAVEHLIDIKADATIDVVINLAGATISERWSKSYKETIKSSRVDTTRSAVQLMHRLKKKPKLFISASAIGYYGSHDAETILDEGGKIHHEFTHEVCALWEEEALKAKEYGIRTCITRLGVVLGKGGGALAKMLPAFRLGLGGKLGSGEQIFSWIHRDDVVRAFDFFITRKKQEGIFNLTAPNPVANTVFTKALGSALNRPTCFAMPGFMVRTLFGEMGDQLLLHGQYVIPKRLQDAGFEFSYPQIEQALKHIAR